MFHYRMLNHAKVSFGLDPSTGRDAEVRGQQRGGVHTQGSDLGSACRLLGLGFRVGAGSGPVGLLK